MIRVPINKPPDVSRRRATIVTVSSVVASVAFAPREALDLATSLVGVGCVIALAAGFGPRATLSLKPWLLTAVGVVTYGAAILVVGQNGPAIVLNIAAVASLAGAASAAYSQRSFASINDRVETQSGRHTARNRWGAALVAGSLAAVLIALRIASLVVAGEGERTNVDPVAGNGGGDIMKAPYASVKVVGRIEDPRVVESSGLVASRSTPDVIWTHNDSGDDPVLYCLRPTGSSCGHSSVTGASALDWEDIAAVGPSAGKELYIGDIGDNEETRPHVTVYVVREPTITDGAVTPTTDPARAIELTYPGGPRDAEALMVHPVTEDLYIMAKGHGAEVDVYKAESPLAARVELRRIATNRILANLTDRTGADISPDGRRVAIATYGGVYELTVSEGERFDSIWDKRATLVSNPLGRQIEAVTYLRDGTAIMFTEEGDRPRLWMSEWLLRS